MPNKRDSASEVQQLIIALVPFARLGLLGCTCHAESVKMPCKHVRSAARDPAILLILQEEARRGTGPHTLDFAGDELRDIFPDEYGSSPPLASTSAEPSSEAKIDVLRDRVKAQQEVRHPQDKFGKPAGPRRKRLGKPIHRSRKQERQLEKEEKRRSA